jgi:hypothetical protein
MQTSQRRVLLVGIALEFAATLLPSWTRVESVDTQNGVALITQSAGFHPLFQPPTRGLSQAIDFGRLSLMWILIALGCAFVWVWVSRREPAVAPGSGDSTSTGLADAGDRGRS